MKYEEVLESIKVGRTFYATALNNIKAFYSIQVQAGFNEEGSAVFVIPGVQMFCRAYLDSALLNLQDAIHILDSMLLFLPTDQNKPAPADKANLKTVYTPLECVNMLLEFNVKLKASTHLIWDNPYPAFSRSSEAINIVWVAGRRLDEFIKEVEAMFANNTLPQAIVKPEAKDNPFPAKGKSTRNSKKKNDGESDNKPESEPADTNTEADIDSAPSANGEHA